jgi:hypothetical protein
MNANGMLIYTRVWAAASTAAQPAAFAIQIGKGLKGSSVDIYKSASKAIGGSIGYRFEPTSAVTGLADSFYDEKTGIFYLDAGFLNSSAITSNTIRFSDTSQQTSGYLVINASKNSSLVGIGLNRIAARGVSTSGQIIPNAASTTVTWDAAKVYDTTGSLNAATGVYTAPETGYYAVAAGILYSSNTWASGDPMDLNITKNGVIVKSNRQNATLE